MIVELTLNMDVIQGSAVTSDVNGLTKAAVTWMSRSGHVTEGHSCTYIRVIYLFDLTLCETFGQNELGFKLYS